MSALLHALTSALSRRERGAAALLLLLAGPALACPGPLVAEVPIRLADGYPLVDGGLGGTPATFLLDTGAQGHAVTPAAARGLPALPGAVRVLGTGGAQDVPAVQLRGLRVGAAPLPDAPAPVLALPPGVPAVAGLLGDPVLHAYDMDLDVPRGRMALHAPKACPHSVGPAWLGAPARIPFTRTAAGAMLLPVTINGVPLQALLDTGSRATILTDATAARLGLRAPVAASTARGVDGQRTELRYVAVPALQVGWTRTAATISVSALQLGGADMVLGLDWIGRRRLWVSYRDGFVGIAPR